MSDTPGANPSQSSLQCIKCGYNLTGVTVGSHCPECGEPVEVSLQSFGRNESRSGTPLATVSFVGPVLLTLFCCVIGGIVSLVYTSKANTAAAKGDVAEYESAVKNRKGWMIASIAIGLLAFAAQIALIALEA